MPQGGRRVLELLESATGPFGDSGGCEVPTIQAAWVSAARWRTAAVKRRDGARRAFPARFGVSKFHTFWAGRVQVRRGQLQPR